MAIQEKAKSFYTDLKVKRGEIEEGFVASQWLLIGGGGSGSDSGNGGGGD
jgi:hypothetical protein